jgi:hypothetical protein
MVHQDKISILVTFAFGLFAGGYLYLTGFATTFELPDTTTDNVYKEFVITGESFGVCKEAGNCSSFQVLENGAYRNIVNGPGLANPLVREGGIPRSLRSELMESLTKESLEANSKLKPTEDCFYKDNVPNFSFRVSLNEVNYTINTCTTDIDRESPAWKSLAKLWNFFAGLK